MNASATGTGANRWRLMMFDEQQAEDRGGQEGEQQIDDEALRVARRSEIPRDCQSLARNSQQTAR